MGDDIEWDWPAAERLCCVRHKVGTLSGFEACAAWHVHGATRKLETEGAFGIDIHFYKLSLSLILYIYHRR